MPLAEGLEKQLGTAPPGDEVVRKARAKQEPVFIAAACST